MNWLLVVCALVCLVLGLLGWHQGFVKMVFRLISFVLALVLAAMLTPMIADGLMRNASLKENVMDNVRETLQLDSLDEKDAALDSDIDKFALPTAIKDQLKKFNNKEGYAQLAVERASDYIAEMVASIIVRAVCFVLLFLIAFVLLIVLSNALNLVVKMPGLNFINKTGGVAVGLLQAFVLVLVAFALVTAFTNTEWGQECYRCINESKILSALYDNNIINGAFVDLTSKMR